MTYQIAVVMYIMNVSTSWVYVNTYEIPYIQYFVIWSPVDIKITLT